MSARPAPADVGGRRVALVHDWLTGMRGGEKALEAIRQLLPGADLFTLLHVPGTVSASLESSHPRPSVVQYLPGAARHYRRYLPVFPTAVELFDLDDYDLVVSTSHCAVKSVIPTGRSRHICYCFTPMRYAWDQFEAYFGPQRVGALRSHLYGLVFGHLARWDAATAGRVTRYIAISQHVADRIRRYYNRAATIVYPPVDTAYYCPDGSTPGGYFLIVSALVPYKRIDLAIEASRLARRPLKIVGDGPERARLESQARAADRAPVEFLGACPDDEIRTLYRGACALLLPGEEDFGIAPVEAQACGRPVIALATGGACETVDPGRTGLLVDEPTPQAFADAMDQLTRARLDSGLIRERALRFSGERFADEMRRCLESTVAAAGDGAW